MTSLLMLAASVALTTLPYTYAGRLVNWNHQAWQDDSPVVVRALNAAGEVLAKTSTTAESDGSSVNYRLVVPLATVATGGYAVSGEKITLQVLLDGVDYSSKIAEGYRTVGKPGEGTRLDLVLAKDSNDDGIPDEYAEYYEYQLGGNFLATDDSDGDGLSNYAEYVAGTSPLDRNDFFAVRSIASTGESSSDDDVFAFTFVASAGRAYSVSSATDLAKPGEWTMLKFRTERQGADRTRVAIGDNPETKTIYVPRDPTATSGFYRLNVE